VPVYFGITDNRGGAPVEQLLNLLRARDKRVARGTEVVVTQRLRSLRGLRKVRTRLRVPIVVMGRVISADLELLAVGGRAEGVEYPLGRRGSRRRWSSRLTQEPRNATGRSPHLVEAAAFLGAADQPRQPVPSDEPQPFGELLVSGLGPSGARGCGSPDGRLRGDYLNWKVAMWVLPSLRPRVNCWQVPAQALSVFQRCRTVTYRRMAALARRLRPRRGRRHHRGRPVTALPRPPRECPPWCAMTVKLQGPGDR
jgi:hypothetical protein